MKLIRRILIIELLILSASTAYPFMPQIIFTRSNSQVTQRNYENSPGAFQVMFIGGTGNQVSQINEKGTKENVQIIYGAIGTQDNYPNSENNISLSHVVCDDGENHEAEIYGTNIRVKICVNQKYIDFFKRTFGGDA